MCANENDMAHGEFGKWLERVEIDRTLATRLMKVADEFDGKYATSHKLSVNILYEIATMPEAERTQPQTIPSTGETKTVDEMTVPTFRIASIIGKRATSRDSKRTPESDLQNVLRGTK